MNRALLSVARAAKLCRDADRFKRLAVERLEDRSLLALAAYQIHLFPADAPIGGPELTTVGIGQSYDLAVSVRDLRAEPTGVYAGYLDIGYDSSKTRVRVAELQRISITAPSSASGSFSLGFGEQTTEEITFNSDAAALATAVEGALAALTGVGAGHVGVTVDLLSSSVTMILQVRFPGKFLDLDVPNLTVASQSLSAGDAPISISYEGDLQGGSSEYAFKEAFRSRGSAADYQNGVTAEEQTDLLDEVGAFADIDRLPGSQARELVRARMIATAAGVITFAPDFEHLNFPASDTLLYDKDSRLELSEIDPGVAKLLTVIVPNVAPSFVKGSDQAANDESGPQSTEGWATAILAGPASEAGQALSFSVTASDPSLFEVQPAIDGTGKLTFTPKLNAEGTTEVTVVLRDNGGTAGGGVDASAAQTFSIQIEKLRPLHNVAMPLDASGDGRVVAGDALECINYINAFGTGAIEDMPAEIEKFLDVDGDRHLSPNDPLTVINYLNAFGPSTGGDEEPEGESGGADEEFASLVALLADDLAGQATRKKRV